MPPAARPLELQHQHTNVVVSSMHVHLDHDHCLEVIILRGRAKVLRTIAAQLRGLKGIRQGQLVIASTAEIA
jgi:CopG family nickel-responsive transcriptional regulator